MAIRIDSTTVRRWALVLVPSMAGGVAASARGAVIRVDDSATGAGNGTSWADAFTRVDSALAAAVAGDEIWVAEGTYTPVDAVSSIVLRSGVALYAGFAGSESSRGERDPAAHLTVLSGDVGQDDTVNTGPGAPAWPNNVVFNTANAGHVVVGSGVDSSGVLDGFIITKGAYGPAGTPAGDPLLFGSGIYCVGGSPTVVNCSFTDNFAAFGNGGAAYLHDSGGSFINCTFTHNLASQGSGGAIYIGGSSSPTIRDCTFHSNLVIATNGQTGQGGALQLSTTLPVTVERCTFDSNIARPFTTGSFEIPRGGAISSFSLSDPATVIRECMFRNNQAPYGAGLFVWNPTTVQNCAFIHNTAFTYDASGGQSVGGDGAGICAQWTDVTVVNCTIANNVGKESAGIGIFELLPNFPAEASIHNTIVWGNVALGQDVSPRNAGIRGTYTALNSCIQDLFTSEPGEDPIDPENYPSCLASNPMLADAAAGDVRLLAGSACIDAGDNALVPPGTSVDLDGSARIVRGLPGQGPSVVDQGAYEFAPAPPSCAGDANGDLLVNGADLSVLLAQFGQAVPANTGADFNGDGVVNGADLSVLLAAFGSAC